MSAEELDEAEYSFEEDEANLSKSNNNNTEDDDEQHTQKLDQIIKKNSELQQDNESLINDKKKYEEIISRYKEKIDSLENLQNDGGAKTSNSKSGSQSIPRELQNELVNFCFANRIFPCPCPDEMGLKEAMDVLRRKPTTAVSRKNTAANSLKSVESGSSDSEVALMERIKGLEGELRLALGAAEDIRALKAKLIQMVERNRLEKEHCIKAEDDLKGSKKKVEMLSDHLEKLMIHLKHEAAAKTRVVENLRVSEKELIRVKEKCDLIARKSAAKDRLILELREGSKVLEDQLRLMDEKFLELRTKLDWAREQGHKKIKKAEKVARDLRTKWSLAGNMTMLDNVPLPSISHDGSQGHIGESGFENSISNAHSWGGPVPDGGSRSSKMKKKGGGSLSMSLSHSSILAPGNEDQGMEYVMEKIRKKNGGKVEWTEEKIRALTKP